MEAWFTDPSKVGAYVILLALVISFFKGWIVPSSTYDRVIKDRDTAVGERDRYLDMLLRANELLGRASISGVEIAKIAQSEIAKSQAANNPIRNIQLPPDKE